MNIAPDPLAVASSPAPAEFLRNRNLATYAILLTIYNLMAVAWGVFVRAARYGDGCGSSWPLCDSNPDPLRGPTATLVEMSHRVSTAIIGPLVVILLVWTWRVFPAKHFARKLAGSALFFTLLEGLIGAVLVKKGLVVNNDSGLRAAVGGFHVVSTFMLVGSLAGCAIVSSGVQTVRLRAQGSLLWLLGIGYFGLVLLGISGAISALGNQLRPTENVIQAALQDATFWMVRVQPTHPIISVAIALYLTLLAGLVQHLRPHEGVRKAARLLVAVLAVQMFTGILNIWLKAPIPMQMIHLVLADLNWITLFGLSIYALGDQIEVVETRPIPAGVEMPGVLKGRDLINAYIALTKPRVISLLLFTTLTTMVIAEGRWPGTILFLVVGVAGYMAAGSANAINMVIDRDIDLSMKRTSTRPTVTQSISSPHALSFALVLAGMSFALLWGFANLLSAVMALSGLVFYVVIYTLLLKRRTWHNIVIGGAAGAFPPLVGWAAVTNSLPPFALYLFAIIFVWTPVHFWALALLLKDDYAAAGVPMLPVVHGERTTVVQIGLYLIVTIVMTLVPAFLPNVGWVYLGSTILLNLILVFRYFKLWKVVDRPRASALFHYSMLYLAVLFLMLAVDRSIILSGWLS